MNQTVQLINDYVVEPVQEFITRYVTNPLVGLPCPDEITEYIDNYTGYIHYGLGEPERGSIQIGYVDQNNNFDFQYRIIKDSIYPPVRNIDQYRFDNIGEPRNIETDQYRIRELNLQFAYLREEAIRYTKYVEGYTQNQYFYCNANNIANNNFTCFCTNSSRYAIRNPLNVDPTIVPTFPITLRNRPNQIIISPNSANPLPPDNNGPSFPGDGSPNQPNDSFDPILIQDLTL